MSLFDNLKNQAAGAVRQTANQMANQPPSRGGRSESVVFQTIPATPAEFAALPQGAMNTPFDTAAMFIVALGLYKVDRNTCFAMINHLKGPQQLNAHDISFLNDRMAQNGKYAFIAESYFVGATPQNDYTPSSPYTIIVSDGPYSYENQGYARLQIASGGADGPRAITMRQAKDSKWYLWEYSSILSDIRAPESSNPWA